MLKLSLNFRNVGRLFDIVTILEENDRCPVLVLYNGMFNSLELNIKTYMLKCGTATNVVVRGHWLPCRTTPFQVSSSVYVSNCPCVQRPSAK